MDKKEKIIKLTKELDELKEKHQHIMAEYAATKEGSVYGVLTTMMYEINLEILNLRKMP